MSFTQKLLANQGSIHLEYDDRGGLVITRMGDKDGPSGTRMVAYDPDEAVLKIFPKERVWDGCGDAYEELKEIWVDLEVMHWDPKSPVEPTENDEYRLVGLPSGVGVVIGYGLSFPRNYNRLAIEIGQQSSCSVLHLTNRVTQVNSNRLEVNIVDFKDYVTKTDRHRGRASEIASRLNGIEAFNTIAKASGNPPRRMNPGRLNITRSMGQIISGETEFDAVGRDVLLKDTLAESRAAARDNAETLGRLRLEVELVSLESLIQEFEKALGSPVGMKESTWQKFFKDNQFCLQQLFSAPVTYVGEQVEVKIPNLHGAGLRRPDFLMVNTVSRVTHLVEIKKPNSKLVKDRPYRGSGGAEVYACDVDLAGAIAQLQAQVQSARTDLSHILKSTPGAPDVHAGIVRGAIIAGRFEELSSSQQDSFLRYRDGLNGVDILTFDEVLERLRGLREVLGRAGSQ